MIPLLTEAALKHCKAGLFDAKAVTFRDKKGTLGRLGKCEYCGTRGMGLGLLPVGAFCCTSCFWGAAR